MASLAVKMLFFSLQSAKKGAFYLINENRQALQGLKWPAPTRLEHFQHGLVGHVTIEKVPGRRCYFTRLVPMLLSHLERMRV